MAKVELEDEERNRLEADVAYFECAAVEALKDDDPEHHREMVLAARKRAHQLQLLTARQRIVELRAHLDALEPWLVESSEARTEVARIHSGMARAVSARSAEEQEMIIVGHIDEAVLYMTRAQWTIEEEARSLAYMICEKLGQPEPDDERARAIAAAIAEAIRPRRGGRPRAGERDGSVAPSREEAIAVVFATLDVQLSSSLAAVRRRLSALES